MSAWTNKTPTESGWYWWRPHENIKMHLLHKIIKDEQGVMRIPTSLQNLTVEEFSKDFPHQQWQKVPEPKD